MCKGEQGRHSGAVAWDHRDAIEANVAGHGQPEPRATQAGVGEEQPPPIRGFGDSQPSQWADERKIRSRRDAPTEATQLGERKAFDEMHLASWRDAVAQVAIEPRPAHRGMLGRIIGMRGKIREDSGGR